MLTAMQQGLLAVVWLLVWWRRIEPKCSSDFVLATAFATGSMIAIASRDATPAWIGVGMAHLCIVAGTQAVRRGIQRFADQRTTPILDALVLSATVMAAMAAVDPTQIRTRIAVLQLVEAGLMAHAAWIIARHLREEFGRSTAWWASSPLWFIAALQIVRLIGVFVAPEHVARSVNEVTVGNIVFAGLMMNSIMIVNLSGFALIAIRVVRRLDDLSRRDAMTGLLNRGAIEQALDDRLQRARRLGTGLALLVLDVDHFKRINDLHGHPVGDAVLVALADALHQSVRTGDVVARAGGEEFWILASEVDSAKAQELAERIRLAIALCSPRVAQSRLQVTASIGVALCHGGAESARDIIVRADQALYAAKAAGRDQVAMASTPETPAMGAPAATAATPASPVAPAPSLGAAANQALQTTV